MTELDELKARARQGVTAALGERDRLRRLMRGLPPAPADEQAELARLEADTRGIKEMMAVLDRMGGRAPRSGTVTVEATGSRFTWGKRASEPPQPLPRATGGKKEVTMTAFDPRLIVFPERTPTRSQARS